MTKVMTSTETKAWAPNVGQVARSLSAHYNNWTHFNRKNPLEELLFIICSLQTNESLYRSTFSSLRRAFPSFDSLFGASEPEIAAAIAIGGLSRQKARSIKLLLSEIVSRFGRPTLAPLKHLTDDAREAFLVSLPGVGKKSARCVLMYCFGASVFPVDSNCWRICRRLGWVRATRPNRSCSPRDMDRLQSKVPPALRFNLHVNMVSLGRDFCTPAQPRCSECPIRKHCRTFTSRRRSELDQSDFTPAASKVSAIASRSAALEVTS